MRPFEALSTGPAVPPGSEVRVGIVVGGRTALARELEDAGVDSLWVGGHVAARSGAAEAMVNLARLSAVCDRALIGTSVLLLPLYPPAIVAKQVADLDRATDGRVVLGVGVGGEFPEEFRACGVPLRGRGARADEAIKLIRDLWTGEGVSHSGQHFTMADVVVLPRPSRAGGPPIVVAGRQEAAMRRAGVLGDGWMPYFYSAERYAASTVSVRAAASAVGRDLTDFGWYAFVFVNVQTDPNVASRELAAALGGNYDQDFASFVDKVACAGDVDQVVAQLIAFVDAGVRHLVLAPAAPEEGFSIQARQIANVVVPRLRHELARRAAARDQE